MDKNRASRARGVSIGAIAAVVLAVLLAGGCGGRRFDSAAIQRARVLPPFPVVIWGDHAALAGDPSGAEGFCAAARRVGVTHLAIEARDPAGNWQLDGDGAPWRRAARDAGLRLAAVLPLFPARADTPTSATALRGQWGAGGWSAAPLLPGGAPRPSPAWPGAQQDAIDSLARVLPDTAIEFVILAGLGFEDAQADIGPAGRAAFENWMAGAVRDWPGDVLGPAAVTLPYGPDGRGPRWGAWVTWRGATLKDLLLRMRAAIAADPAPPRLIVLADAPYPTHLRLGLNWALPGAPVAADHPWLPARYNDYTAAGHLVDAVALAVWEPQLATAPEAEAAGFAWWASMEGSLALARRVRDESEGLWVAIPVAEGNGWPRAVRLATALADGIVLIGAREFQRDDRNWELLAIALGGG